MSDKLYELLKSSTIVQGMITFCIIITLCILVIEGKDIPTTFIQFGSLILGFYFGAKVQNLIQKAKG